MDLPMPMPAQVRGYDEQAPDSGVTETATFALGCFWGPDAEFGAIDGIVRTRVGYAGGSKSDPTYRALGDHTEAFQVEYDPRDLSYSDLLDVAFRSHDPRHQTAKTQYQNVVFLHGADQREALEAALADRGLSVEGIETRVEPLDEFHLAEDYHQKYNLRSNSRLLGAFEDAGYDDEAIRKSPAAAKLNGAAAGHDVSVARELGLTGERAGRTDS